MSGAFTNAELAREWRCTPRHVSKVRTGRGDPQCKDTGCGCPLGRARHAEALKRTCPKCGVHPGVECDGRPAAGGHHEERGV